MTYDTDNGRNPAAATEFIKAISELVQEPGYELTITVGNLKLTAYDHAALVNGIIEAVEYYAAEIS